MVVAHVGPVPLEELLGALPAVCAFAGLALASLGGRLRRRQRARRRPARRQRP
jgi:hypothetical protein